MYYDPTGYMGNPCKPGNISEGGDEGPKTNKNGARDMGLKIKVLEE
jgi:hypothetical protein